MSSTGRPLATPARWHVRTRYTYDRATGEWKVTELMREFAFDPVLLIDAEFDQPAKKDVWDEAIGRVQTADNPDAMLDEEFTATEEFYREVFSDVPENQLDKMLTVLRQEFRRRAGLK